MSPKLAARVYATDIILGTEKHYRHWEEIKKKDYRGYFPCFEALPKPLVSGGNYSCYIWRWGVMTPLPVHSSLCLCLCLQPAGIPVCRCLWGRTVLQRPRLPTLPPLLRHLCWYLLSQSSCLFFWLWFGFCLPVFIHHSCKPIWYF